MQYQIITKKDNETEMFLTFTVKDNTELASIISNITLKVLSITLK